MLVALSPAVKRLGHDEDNSFLSSAEIESYICLPPYTVLAYIISLLFYIIGSRCRFEMGGGRLQTCYDTWSLTLVTVCGSHICYGDGKIWP